MKEVKIPMITEPSPGQRTTAVLAVCGKCGMEIYRVMTAECDRSDCPTGLNAPVNR
jgi:ribosomal protein L37E